MRHICVYCSSSDRLSPGFYEVGTEFGRTLAQRGHVLVYGGGTNGIMGAVARGVKAGGGHVVGVIPDFMKALELEFREADELITVSTMRERKQAMEEMSDAFVALPGGWGTLEEVMEILVLRQLQQHEKPTVFLNHAGFYDHLLAFFEHMIAERFGRPTTRSCFAVRDTVPGVLEFLESYKPTPPDQPWFVTR
jgi:uncharacterized protein (TIGR00730 family)